MWHQPINTTRFLLYPPTNTIVSWWNQEPSRMFLLKRTAVLSWRRRIPKRSEYIMMVEPGPAMNYAVFTLVTCHLMQKSTVVTECLTSLSVYLRSGGSQSRQSWDRWMKKVWHQYKLWILFNCRWGLMVTVWKIYPSPPALTPQQRIL